MKFIETSLPGVWLIEDHLHEDERGFLTRTYCERDFRERGLNTYWPQCNLTRTKKRGMIRGMHYQAEPKPEIKIIRCIAGAVFDVLTDIRPGSPTYKQWEGFELSPDNHRALYAPVGFAHGLQCLDDNCDVFYHMSEFYFPELARGFRWDDPSIGIAWPLPAPILSQRDQSLPVL